MLSARGSPQEVAGASTPSSFVASRGATPSVFTSEESLAVEAVPPEASVPVSAVPGAPSFPLSVLEVRSPELHPMDAVATNANDSAR
jgi:hypothetical protein